IHTGADFTTNIALKTGANPEELIKKIKKSKLFSKIENNKNFINLWVKQEMLIKNFQNFLLAKKQKPKIKGIKINVEFLSSNPTGMPQLGNGRNGFWGHALCNILKASGNNITREFYLNDSKESKQIQELGMTVLGKAKTYNSPYLKQKIKELKKNKILNENSLQKNPGEIGRIMAEAIFKDMKSFFKKINIKFDNFFSEDELYSSGVIKQLLTILEDKNLVYMKDGALWIKLKEFGHTQDEVIVRSNGKPTYLMADIAYHKNKFERNFDKLIVILGADHHSHASRLKIIAKIWGYNKPFDILITQLVRVKHNNKTSKMSKRLGTAVELEKTINNVGADATRFMLLSQSIESHMVFDTIFSISKLELKFIKQEEINLIKKVLELQDVVLEISQNYKVNLLTEYLSELAKLFHNYYDKYRIIDEKNIKTTEIRLVLITGVKMALGQGLKLLGINAPEKM
ncbi:MAG: Arginine-tRNA ligase, partial [Parcubacteria group bacterium GW2011_GWA2_31_28]